MEQVRIIQVRSNGSCRIDKCRRAVKKAHARLVRNALQLRVDGGYLREAAGAAVTARQQSENDDAGLPEACEQHADALCDPARRALRRTPSAKIVRADQYDHGVGLHCIEIAGLYAI